MTQPNRSESAAPDTAATNADDVTRQYVTTRRTLIAGTTGIMATSLAGCMGGGSSPETVTETATKSENGAGDMNASPHPDIDILNYALTLEHLEHAFYRDGLNKYNDEQLVNASALDGFSDTVQSSVPDRLAKIRDHEQAHVDTITQTVKKLGGKPVSEANYDFGYENPSELLGVAKALKNTGVAAYAGAADTIENDKVFKAAAKIHDVEARHASFLNELNSESSFPKVFDEAKSMEEVKKIAGQFIKDS